MTPEFQAMHKRLTERVQREADRVAADAKFPNLTPGIRGFAYALGPQLDALNGKTEAAPAAGAQASGATAKDLSAGEAAFAAGMRLPR